MRYERVKVNRDTHTVYNRSVYPWEVPILEYIFEGGNIERLNQFETVSGEYPSAASEFDRLTRAYGADAKSGIPHVATVYGDSGRGVRELQKAIDEARAAEMADSPRISKAARTQRTSAPGADPLMV